MIPVYGTIYRTGTLYQRRPFWWVKLVGHRWEICPDPPFPLSEELVPTPESVAFQYTFPEYP